MNTSTFKPVFLDAPPMPARRNARKARPHRNSRNLLLCAAILLVFPVTGSAQSFSVSWFKIAGGGGTSTNGQYALSGTIGQHDAGGPMINGPYALTGGFWSFLSVVQTPGAPTLKLLPAGLGHVTISWLPNTPGYRLQETLVLSPVSWVDSPSGTANPVTVPIGPPAKYYRLITP